MTPEKRRALLEELLSESPDDAELRYSLAMEDVGAGDHASAVTRFRELIARQPQRPYVPAFLMAAQSLVKLGKTGEACAMLRDGIEAARQQNNQHALSEMLGMLDSLE